MPRVPKPWWRKDRKAWFVTINGKRHNLGGDREAAFRSYHEMMAKPPATATVDSVYAIVDRFLNWTKNNRADGTYRFYREKLQQFVDAVSNMPASNLKPYHVQEWVDANGGWSDGQKRQCITAVKRAFRWARRMGHLDHDPVAYLEKPEAGRRENVVPPTVYQQMLATTPDEQFQHLLTVAWECGPRPQEILRVEGRHVDTTHDRWIFQIKESKGKRRTRVVYLTDTAMAITRRLMLKYPDGPLFRNTEGRPWHPYAVNCRFEKLQQRFGRQEMEKQGVDASESDVAQLVRQLTEREQQKPARRRKQVKELVWEARGRLRAKQAKAFATKYCLYDFRHSFATRLLEAGVDSLTVSIYLGHVDTTMLAKVYQHVYQNPDHLSQQLKQTAG